MVRIPRSRQGVREFDVGDTHGIALWPGNRLLADSRGLGWRDTYTSLATESSWAGDLRALPHYCLAYCANRSAQVSRTIEGERTAQHVVLEPRMFGTVPMGRTSRWRLIGAPDIQLVYLRRSVVDTLAEEAFGLSSDKVDIVPKLGFVDPLLEQLVLALLDAARNDTGEDSSALLADQLVRLMALQLLRGHSNRPQAKATRTFGADMRGARMRHIRDLIDSHLGEDLGLERLAREANVSTHAFAAAFRKAFQVAPHQYILQRRIERAKELLRDTDDPIADIAYQAGFASQSHLTAAFAQRVGTSPGAYRRRLSSASTR
jgi:AraC family transcriptional regulator